MSHHDHNYVVLLAKKNKKLLAPNADLWKKGFRFRSASISIANLTDI